MAESVREGLCGLYTNQEEGARGFLRLFERLLVVPLYDHLRAGEKKIPRVEWKDNRPVFCLNQAPAASLRS